jgi:hypothetical protein
MGENTMVIGKMENSMERENIFYLMAVADKVYGRMEKD